MQILRKATAVLPIAALSLPACILAPVPAAGQILEGSGMLAEETRAVSGITAVELAMPGTSHIELGATDSLRISAEHNLLSSIRTEARGGELMIESSPGVDLRPREPIDYYLTVTGLDTLSVSSSGDVEAPDLQATHFSLSITSSGNLTRRSLQAETLDIDISSSGNLAIGGGQVRRQEITLSSSGNYLAQGVDSLEAEADLSSGDNATVRVQDTLHATLSSSGRLYYIGSPEVHADISSSGQAVQIEG